MISGQTERLDKFGMFRLIADKVERYPVLLQVRLDIIARWVTSGIGQQRRLRQREEMILAEKSSSAGTAGLLAVFSEDSERAEEEMFRAGRDLTGVSAGTG
ncbi:MAG: hypothetical protein WCO94_03165 [Verrucomicrobiota bacterium]